MSSHALRDERASAPIAPLHITEGLLRCSTLHRSALSTAVALLDALLVKDHTMFMTLLDAHDPGFSSPDLRYGLSDLLSSLSVSEDSLNIRLSHLHATFDFETPEGIILSKNVSKTVMLALEFTTTVFMGQFDRLSFWVGHIPASFGEFETETLINKARHHTFGHLGGELPFVAKASYELQKVLQRYWSVEKPHFSVERDGLLVRYTSEPAPECVFRHADTFI